MVPQKTRKNIEYIGPMFLYVYVLMYKLRTCFSCCVYPCFQLEAEWSVFVIQHQDYLKANRIPFDYF